MKKFFIAVLILTFSLLCVSVYGAQDGNIDVLYHGEAVSFDAEPYYSGGRIMVPVRAIFEALGATVEWNEETQSATSYLGTSSVTMTLGSNIYISGGTEYVMDASVEMHSDRIFAPARYAAQAFGKKISYHENSETAIISDSNEYEYYASLSEPVPDFKWVKGAELAKTQKLSNGSTAYTYSCGENGISDYLNFLQLDFAYEPYDMEYLSDAASYIYINNKLKISITEYADNSGLYTVEIVPDTDGSFSAQKNWPPEPEPVPEDTPVMEDITYSDVDYGKITGSALLDTYTNDDGIFYVYQYDMLSAAYYESYIEANGWRFYDYKFDIDSFSTIKYWVKDDIILCVSTNNFYDVVMVSVLQ